MLVLICACCVAVWLWPVVDGKNMDMVQIWKHEHLHWGPRMSSNFEIVYGLLNIFSGNSVTPFLLKRLTARQFTTLTNLTNTVGFFMRGAAERGSLFLAAAVPMMPGVNGAHASALKSIATSHAERDGIGLGEFSAWTNNLRAIAGAIASWAYASYYAFCVRRQIFPPGTMFVVMGTLGAFVPQLLLTFLVSDDELEVSKGKAVAK
jgi:hypothetical protein